jgi:predicted transcriptional regulator
MKLKILYCSFHALTEPARIARIVCLLANAELQGTLAEFTTVNKRPTLSIVVDVMEMVGWLRARQREKEATAENNAQVLIENRIDPGG